MSQLDHACQAALQARKAGYPDPVMVGALLHDIGWKLATADPRMSCGEMSEVYEQTPSDASVAARLGILAVIGADHGMAAGQQRAQHDVIGATFLRMHGFDERCARLVEGHVLAKRYLCFAEPGYYDILSAGSQTTLAFQGGPMSAEEAKLFEADPYFDLYKTMRRWDEGAKDVDCEPIPFEDFLPVIAEQIQHLPCTAAEATARATFAREGNVIKGVRSRFAVPDSFRLTAEDRRMWTEEGYVVLRGWLSPENVGSMLQYVEEVQAGIKGPLYQYEEGVRGQTVPARTEDFIDYHAGMAELLRNDGPLAAVVADLVGEDVSIYKEKINYKLPGGGGYKAHQDGYRGLGVPQGPYEFMAYGACALTAAARGGTARPARLTATPPARSVHDRGRRLHRRERVPRAFARSVGEEGGRPPGARAGRDPGRRRLWPRPDPRRHQPGGPGAQCYG